MGLFHIIPGKHKERHLIAVGQPYFVSEGRIISAVCTILYPWLNQWWIHQPLLLPAEVYKVYLSPLHFFKAKEQFCYVPVVSPQEGMATTISYWQERKGLWMNGPVPFFRAIILFLFRSLPIVKVVFLVAAAAHVLEAV
ncbi:putative transmembrane protein [Rosa chinensis]|uniref:Putative transmembrane protein n=1 Tax=Rosa chinensis TaxID=74649 RepID=A0A2P6PBT3_ROSCH|nr:putative transmembrane protein [Rosa chinensis]